jgi:hypothetical protein
MSNLVFSPAGYSTLTLIIGPPFALCAAGESPTGSDVRY